MPKYVVSRMLQALDKYSRDLTQAARDGKLDPVIGRDDEIRRTVQILSRRTKNNPILLGEPGELVERAAVDVSVAFFSRPSALEFFVARDCALLPKF